MPVTVTSTSTVSSNTIIGFASSSPENKAMSDALLEWTAQQPGFISQSFHAEGQGGPVPKTHTYTVVWETVEDYAAFVAARKERIEKMTVFFIFTDLYWISHHMSSYI